ncbi:TonB-dependent receptor [Sphingopyxis sp. YF1]|uniref:TonB-dependent receptor plug domain-containing protein n=1 Tax=Sphingopyxis sp. YF1 TaxID=2482763 RepID=UPI001F60BBDC|nr:TonB-dependent receptor [Sphingopyxis sp. YF1]UNU42562.1 TonB-dependent receptor [Sphingopyxis sp. YF1]
MKTYSRLLIGASCIAGAVSVPAFAQDAATADAGDSAAQSDIIVTGTRGQARTVISSPTPIDVIGGEDIEKLGGGMQLRDALTQLVPSFQSTTVGSSSFNSLTRPAGLRGLSGVHVLVLVNGKRRHNSSIIDFNSGATSQGGNPVDLDLIPSSAIERIEVLRDGASAQYGSDAIAGVINVILKTNDSGGRATIEAGQRYGRDGSGSDGETISGSVSHGFALGDGGSFTLSVEGKKANAAVRNSDVTGRLYALLPGGAQDPRELTANRRTYLGGLPEVTDVKVAQTLVLPLGNVTFYSDGTFGYRDARVGQAGRRPSSNQNILEIYPDGFSPFYTLQETDFQLTGGLRGDAGGWNIDLSSTYGRNHAKNGAENTLNASLGPSSPTEFKTFSSAFDQWTNNLDLTRRVDLGGDMALQVSMGAEYRYESYVTKPLDVDSYRSGGYFYPSGEFAGKPAQVGAQGAIVVTPEDAADVNRNVWAGYVDLALDVSPRFLVTAAGRFEHFDDSSGSVFSGKVSARYELTDWLAFRGAFSNGFRAPSLAQQDFAQTSTSINLVDNAYIPVLTKIVKTNSAVAQALGAQPLKPEKSKNYSLGFTLTPTAGLSLSVDAYQIDLDNRITLTGLLSGPGIRNILLTNGFSGDQSVRFFTNAVDTRTRGIDVVGTYAFDVGSVGRLRTSVGFNYNDTDIREIAANPPELAGLSLTLFDRRTQGWFTEGPKTKLILGASFESGPFALSLKETRYDSFRSLDNAAKNDQSFGAKWITDLELSYGITEKLRVAAGAYNIFDVYPDRTTVTNTIGLAPYGAGPFGQYGGYYYGRIAVEF